MFDPDFFLPSPTSDPDFVLPQSTPISDQGQAQTRLLPSQQPDPLSAYKDYSNRNFSSGIEALTSGASDQFKSILEPRIRPFTAENLQKNEGPWLPGQQPLDQALRLGRNSLNILGGGIQAVTAPITAAATTMLAPAIGQAENLKPIAELERMLGADPEPVARAVERWMPDIVAIFGPAVFDKVAKMARAGMASVDDIAAMLKGPGSFRDATPPQPSPASTPRIKNTDYLPETLDLPPASNTLPGPVNLSKSQPFNFERMEYQPARSPWRQFGEDLTNPIQKPLLQDAGLADATSLKGSPWFPETATSPASMRNTERVLAEKEASQTALADAELDRLFGKEPIAPADQSPFRQSQGMNPEGYQPPEQFYSGFGTDQITDLIQSGLNTKPGQYLFGREGIKSPEVKALQSARSGGLNSATYEGDRLNRELLDAARNGTPWWKHLTGETKETKDSLLAAYDYFKTGSNASLNKLKDNPRLEQATRTARASANFVEAEMEARGLPINLETKGQHTVAMYLKHQMGGERWAKIIDPKVREQGIQALLENEKILEAGKYRPVTAQEATAIADDLIKGQKHNYITSRTQMSARIPTGKFTKKLEMDDRIRALFGPIEDISYVAGRQVQQGVQTITNYDYLNQLSKTMEKVNGIDSPVISPTPLPGYTKVEMNDLTRKALGQKGDQPIFVLEKYASDFYDTFGPSGQQYQKNMGDATLDWLTAQWKGNKTYRSIGTQLMNFIGNPTFAILSRTSITNPTNLRFYRDAAKALWKQEPVVAEMIRVGNLGPEVTKADMLKQAGGFVNRLGKESIWDITKNITRNTLGQADDLAAYTYNYVDAWYKTAAYLKRKALGDTPEMAAAHVRKFYPRYDLTSPFINDLRTSRIGKVVASPMVSFFAETVRISKNAAKENPWALGGVLAAIPATTYAAAVSMGMSYEDLRRAYAKLPLNLRGFATLLLPWKDDKGSVQFVDLSYAHPLGQLAKGPLTEDWDGPLSDLPIVRDLFGGSPILTTGLEIGKNIKLGLYGRGQQVSRPLGDLTDYISHAAQSFLPPLAPGGTGMNKVLKAAAGRPVDYGQKKTALETLLGEVTRIRPVSINARTAAFTQGLQNSELRKLEEDLRWSKNEFKLGKIDGATLRKRQLTYEQEKKAITHKYQAP